MIPDLTHKKFGRLKVLAEMPVRKRKHRIWFCRCVCGEYVSVRTSSLLSGHTKSCGCLGTQNRVSAAKKALTKHGKTGTRTHNIWMSMRQRCENPNNPRYADYGGRGIKVCARWADFDAFLADMGECPPRMAIERKNNDGNYEPSNCKWASNKEQCNNTRRCVFVEHNGKRQTLSQWASELGIGVGTLWARINKYGWTVDRALSQ